MARSAIDLRRGFLGPHFVGHRDEAADVPLASDEEHGTARARRARPAAPSWTRSSSSRSSSSQRCEPTQYRLPPTVPSTPLPGRRRLTSEAHVTMSTPRRRPPRRSPARWGARNAPRPPPPAASTSSLGVTVRGPTTAATRGAPRTSASPVLSRAITIETRAGGLDVVAALDQDAVARGRRHRRRRSLTGVEITRAQGHAITSSTSAPVEPRPPGPPRTSSGGRTRTRERASAMTAGV